MDTIIQVDNIQYTYINILDTIWTVYIEKWKVLPHKFWSTLLASHYFRQFLRGVYKVR